MIDEKKLIEDLKEKIAPERFGERCNAMDVINGVLQVISEQPKTDWIPCEERLPSESGTYLVTDKVFNGESISYKTDTAYFNGEIWHSDFEGTCNGRTDIGRRVIAWSNLPQPYKKEGVENDE